MTAPNSPTMSPLPTNTTSLSPLPSITPPSSPLSTTTEPEPMATELATTTTTKDQDPLPAKIVTTTSTNTATTDLEPKPATTMTTMTTSTKDQDHLPTKSATTTATATRRSSKRPLPLNRASLFKPLKYHMVSCLEGADILDKTHEGCHYGPYVLYDRLCSQNVTWKTIGLDVFTITAECEILPPPSPTSSQSSPFKQPKVPTVNKSTTSPTRPTTSPTNSNTRSTILTASKRSAYNDVSSCSSFTKRSYISDSETEWSDRSSYSDFSHVSRGPRSKLPGIPKHIFKVRPKDPTFGPPVVKKLKTKEGETTYNTIYNINYYK
ncbi:hypothetical protein BJ085DRAFT_27511 [Dimargaris cristalligena]|uniref:Uncharacterized protein n=1 Tax=Dimargaris cristalligena TaxID=215637 RepID=A0A4V1J3Z5_9FUNG|nr:hypothetical protein BJ085DRAFT_27511 [Dimargaris cristalligena]|eukprot:RKP33779.1 hypothetical protein BJ085DRAFT_27511 [Dimargaris cristalligena]